jgi:hypothetical protein
MAISGPGSLKPNLRPMWTLPAMQSEEGVGPLHGEIATHVTDEALRVTLVRANVLMALSG